MSNVHVPIKATLAVAPAHLRELRAAVQLLENPQFAARLADYAGKPMNAVLNCMPTAVNQPLRSAIRIAIFKCLTVATGSFVQHSTFGRSEPVAKLLTGLAGGVGGFFGLTALTVELPLTTMLMLRSIAQIANSEGEDLKRLEARLACLEVFTLGVRAKDGEALESYYGIRTVLTNLISENSPSILQQGAINASSPIIAKLVGEIAARIGLILSDMATASAVPVVGAIGGAMVNIIFMDHFQRIAHGHFAVRRLERLYGLETIQRHYQRELNHLARNRPIRSRLNRLILQ